MQPKISVIMPVYNCAEYLSDAVRSVLSGGVDELELWCIDDCSTDASREILAELARADDRIHPVYNEQNMGVAAVRNLALDLAKGEYLAFCDSDDTIPEGAYAALLSSIEDADVAVGNYENLSDGGVRRLCVIDKAEKATPFLTLFSVSCLWTKLIRRAFIVEHGLRFDPDMRVGEDVVFLAHLATKSPRVRTTEAVVYHHIHHATAATPSLIHTYTAEAFRRHIECRRRLLTVCADIPECREYVFRHFSYFLDSFLTHMAPGEERERAYTLYRDYMRGYDWENRPAEFLAITGVSYEQFLTVNASEYLRLKEEIEPRDRVAYEFAAGCIGLRWVIKYFKLWANYKLKRTNRRSK